MAVLGISSPSSLPTSAPRRLLLWEFQVQTQWTGCLCHPFRSQCSWNLKHLLSNPPQWLHMGSWGSNSIWRHHRPALAMKSGLWHSGLQTAIRQGPTSSLWEFTLSTPRGSWASAGLLQEGLGLKFSKLMPAILVSGRVLCPWQNSREALLFQCTSSFLEENHLALIHISCLSSWYKRTHRH